jgi:hypothetical protein
VGAACSSSNSQPNGSPDSGSSSSSGGGTGDGGTPTLDGSGPPCTPLSQEVVGAKLSLDVVWPVTLANAGSTMGTLNIWLLTNYNISGNKLSGTVTTCKNQIPPVPLSGLGAVAEGISDGGAAIVDVQISTATWKAIAMHKAPTMTTGTLGGWNVGSSIATDPVTTVYGLNTSSKYADPTVAWPCSESSLMMSDLSDDDNDMKPGVTDNASNLMGYVYPAVASAPGSPQADELYVATRTQLSLYGKSTSCTDVSGEATVQLLNNHIVGCHLNGMPATTLCPMSQYDYVDSNTTVFLGQPYVMGGSVMVPAGGSCTLPVQIPPKISGTFQSKILASDGGTATCDDVLAALP